MLDQVKLHPDLRRIISSKFWSDYNNWMRHLESLREVGFNCTKQKQMFLAKRVELQSNVLTVQFFVLFQLMPCFLGDYTFLTCA